MLINGAELGSAFSAPAIAGIWELYEHNWSSGTNTIAVIEIINLSTIGDIGSGNDFALDDISFTPGTVPIPPALWLFGSGLLGLVSVTRFK